MGKLTSATEEQQKSVASMIDAMLKPKRSPAGMSFTLGWDVVASYSEKQINGLLAKRHASKKGNMLRDFNTAIELEDFRTGDKYTLRYKLKFGPPLIQFDGRSQKGPMCSLTMAIVGGTMQPGDDMPERPVKAGYSLVLNGIPLGAARGDLVNGKVDGNPDITPGHKTVHFDFDEDQQEHVVLNFPLATKDLVVSVLGPTQAEAAKSDLNKTTFQDTFKQFFTDPSNATALSYSIASVNNTSVKYGSRDLEPVNFQFASFSKAKHDDADGGATVLSVFIGVKGGAKTGVDDGLQPRWQSQWLENGASPIPFGFTASLILSAGMVYQNLLVPGFKSANWNVTNISDANGTGIKIEAKNTDRFKSPAISVPYSTNSKFWVGGLDIPLDQWPMKLSLVQSTGRDFPRAFCHWKLEQSVEYVDHGKFLNISFLPTTWGSENVKITYRICDSSNVDNPRELPCKVTMNDEAFNLDINLSGDVWRMDEARGTHWYDFPVSQDNWNKVIDRVKTFRPKTEIKSIGLGFLRTTNLLTPDQEAIDFNEGIGLKVPRDFVLVGDVLET